MLHLLGSNYNSNNKKSNYISIIKVRNEKNINALQIITRNYIKYLNSFIQNIQTKIY